MAPRRIIAFCLNSCIILSQETVTAFSPSTMISQVTTTTTTTTTTKTTTRDRPLHSFEVMASVEATATDTSIMSTITSFFQAQPYLAGFLTCSFKASAADMIAQSKERLVSSSEENDVDISRNLGFLFYGGIYQGMCQNFIYNVIYPSWFGTDQSLALIGKELLVDNLIFAPFLCLPIAYAFKAAFASAEDEPLSLDTFRQGLDKYIQDVTTKGLLTQYWTLWFPANAITFGVIPPHFRVVFVAAVSFFWVCILSSISASEQEPTQVTEPTATPAAVSPSIEKISFL
jgi:protein Mpv17